MKATRRINKLKRNFIIIIIVCLLMYILVENKKLIKTDAPITDSTFIEKQLNLFYDANVKPMIHYNNKREIFFVTKDIVKLVGINGEVFWDYSINLNYPKLEGNGDSIVVVEVDGRSLLVFNNKGILFNKTFDNKIVNFTINKNSYVGVILESEDSYKIQVFDVNGYLIYDASINYENQFLTNLSISDDNKILVYSTIDINSMNLKSQIVFAYINEEDTRENESTVFSYEYLEDDVVGIIKIFNKNLVVVSSNGIYSYDLGANPQIKELFRMNLNNNIDFIDFSSNGTFALVLGEENGYQKSELKNVLQFYNKNGSKTGEILLDEPITYLKYNTSIALVGTGNTFYAINNKGKLVWSKIFNTEIITIDFLTSQKDLLVVGNTETYILEKK